MFGGSSLEVEEGVGQMENTVGVARVSMMWKCGPERVVRMMVDLSSRNTNRSIIVFSSEYINVVGY